MGYGLKVFKIDKKRNKANDTSKQPNETISSKISCCFTLLLKKKISKKKHGCHFVPFVCFFGNEIHSMTMVYKTVSFLDSHLTTYVRIYLTIPGSRNGEFCLFDEFMIMILFSSKDVIFFS